MSASPVPSPPVLPPPLHRGDSVIVIAPASAPRDVSRYSRGLNVLRRLYDVEVLYSPEDATSPYGYLSAPDERRLADLHAALRDPKANAIIAARGGYGAMRLLDRMDLDAGTAHPKWVVGYSDVTALQMHLYRHLRWVSLSGPVVTEWAQASNVGENARAMDEKDGPSTCRIAPKAGCLPDVNDPSRSPDIDAMAAFHQVASRDEPEPLLVAEGLPVLTGHAGTVTGPLLGGNLSVLTRLIGTPAFPDLGGAILVLEDVGEPPYRIDRMLTHLHLAGHLDNLAGVILGSFRTGDVRSPSLSMDEVFRDRFAHSSCPVVSGLAYGHIFPRLTLPLGAPARLTLNDKEATLDVTLHRPIA